MLFKSFKPRRAVLWPILIFIFCSLLSCGRYLYVEGTIHLVDYIDEEDRSFGVDGESIGSGEELPVENSPVISLELSSELNEVVVTDEMWSTVGVQIDMESFSGEVDLNLHIKAFISDHGEPEIWSETPAFEVVIEHVQDSASSYSESTYDLLERFQDVLHSAEPVYLALKGSLENTGGAGSYAGRVTIQLLDIHYSGHKEL